MKIDQVLLDFFEDLFIKFHGDWTIIVSNGEWPWGDNLYINNNELDYFTVKIKRNSRIEIIPSEFRISGARSFNLTEPDSLFKIKKYLKKYDERV